MTTNDRLGRNHRPSENWDECSVIFLGEEADVGMKGEALCQKQTGEARQSRHKRNHRPSENWDECSLIFLGEEADVGMKGEALCQKKRVKPVNHGTRAKLNKRSRASPSVQPPSYHLQVALKYLRWVFVLDVTRGVRRNMFIFQ
jgi:hypothetical protein